jgi:hypothetical protein
MASQDSQTSDCTILSIDSYIPPSSPAYRLSPSPLISSSDESVLNSITSTPKQRPRTSWVYRHMPAEDIETRYTSNNGKDLWKCKYCTKTYATNGGTSVIKKHLSEKHHIGDLSQRQTQAIKRQMTLQEAHNTNATTKRRRLSPGGESIAPDILEKLVVKLIVNGNLAFNFIELPAFKELCLYLNSDTDSWLPNSHSTAKIWLIRAYKEAQIKVQHRLYNSASKIHICADVWTSPNNLPVLGITAQFVSQLGHLEQAVLSMKELQGGHSGTNLCTTLLDTLLEWDLLHKVGYFQADNASNNNTLCDSLETGKSLFYLQDYTLKHITIQSLYPFYLSCLRN